MALMYLLVFVAGIVVMVLHEQLAQDKETPAIFWVAYGAFIACLGLAFGGAFVAALFLPAKPWVWVCHLVLISLGLTSVCCMPVCIPLLIQWLKPDVRAYFGRTAA
jgi:hypothetical protein